MKRNMDLIRTIVLAIRDHDGRPSATEVQTLIRADTDAEEDNGVFGYHIALLSQGELMTGVQTGPRKDRHGMASLALTWAGQDFADNILNDEVWESARKTLSEAELESASFPVWSKILVSKITERCSGR